MNKQKRRAWLNNLAKQPLTDDVITQIILGCDDLLWFNVHKFNMYDTIAAYAAAEDGLLKAIYSYDKSKPATFLTYASVCIYNEIGMLYRKNKNQKMIYPLDAEAYEKDGVSVSFIDMLADNTDFVNDKVHDAMHAELQGIIVDLVASYDKVIYRKILQTWIDSDYKMHQSDIAALHNMSQSYVSRITSMFKKDLKKKIKNSGVLIK